MFISFIGVAVLSLGIGFFAQRNEIYLFGVVLLLFTGLWALQEGISEPIGTVINDSGVVTVVTTTYDVSNSVWTNGWALLLIVSGAGLSLHFVRNRKEKMQQKLESVDDEE